ncbi:MAG TPA: lysylphosphatidylglycerol synthase transmembrane domain-containing protein [Thermomicrobiales bacterium]|nr:lysylphosphatidylglycerol synthase transmembrane domain-containing protein [Thermomicrobiales bacterium]
MTTETPEVSLPARPAERPAPSVGPENAAILPPSPELADQEERRPESLGKRFLRPRTAISFAFAAAILAFVFRGLDINPGEVWAQLKQANLPLFLAALATYYLSFVVRALRWTQMLARVDIDREHGHDVPRLGGMVQILILSWFANCVVPARLGDAYRGYLLKQRAKASFGVTLGTILAERLIDLVVLVSVLLGAGLIVFGTSVPTRAEQAFVLGAGVVVFGIIGVLVLWFARERVERFLPPRLMSHFHRLHTGIFRILSRPTNFALVGVLLWLGDGLRVFLVTLALSEHISYPSAVVVALISALVTIVPITPAGLGVVEGFMIWALPQVGVAPEKAAAIAFLDRFITYWSLILVGLPLYIWMLRRDITVTDDDTR